MNIGEVSRMVNMPVSTIRYYDNEGLFTSLKKDSAGNRVFLKEDLEQLKIIECLKKSGMQIKEIKQFMTWVAEGSQTIPQRKEMFLHRKEVVKNKMKEISKFSSSEMIDYTLKNNKNTIISIAVYDENGITYNIYGGEYNLNYDYEIGSATKTFTAMLISRAVEEGKINLDDNISNYLELENRYYPTIKRIITHTSGFKPYYLSFQKIKNYFSGGNDFYNISKEQLLKELNKTKLEDKDYDFNYSNFGISTLGLILEKVYYKDYNELQEEYFKELDMNNTSVAIGKGNLRGYWKWNEDDGYIPTGAIISNIEDMSKYLETLITSDESYIIKTQEPLTDVRAVNDIYNIFDINVDKVGMTWMIDNKNDIIWHNGSTTNFNSYIGYNKEKKVGVVVLSNLSPKSDVNMTFIGNKILHEMLDK